jgi:exodeoxyribonuclease VII large subunit
MDLFSESLHIPSVSELTGSIKQTLEEKFVDVLVQGEVSQPKTSANGHTYFTLKDEKAQLPCVIWRSTAQQLNLDLLHGQQIVVGGDIQVYPPHGKYQLIVTYVKQAGIGALQKAFEELKQKLKSEGLFDPDHKKPLPGFPGKIGVVTSSTGAAFQDIRSTLEKKFPMVTVYLYHASVQGVNAAPEIVKGINYFSKNKNVDVLIIGRGGGSLEDLWPFNEEAVARAVYDCEVPVISGVGHETDFSISDFVADARAATPTQAASMAVPDINELRFYVDDMDRKLKRKIFDILKIRKERVQQLIKAHGLLVVSQKVYHQKERINGLQYRMQNTIHARFHHIKEKYQNLHYLLGSYNPNEPLDKGYVRILQNDKWIRKSTLFKKDLDFKIQWKDREDEISRTRK